jgi:4-carboxymuconolactone decarboxylase
MNDSAKNPRWDDGIKVVDSVYGAGSAAMMAGLEGVPFVAETVEHVFGEIWSRPGLSMRDKRLLVLGATAMLGRPDLVTIQVAGAIVNEELTDTQLDEIPLLMLFYAGAGNATAMHQGIQAAKARAKDIKPG